MTTIEIDDDVLVFLRSRIRDFHESPNSVLRRELGLDSVVAKAPPSLAISRVGNLPEALSQILDVVEVMRRESTDRVTATLLVARQRGVARETIADKYGRQLGLTTEQFDQMLEEDGYHELRARLSKKFPRFKSAIDAALGRWIPDRGTASSVPDKSMIILKTSGPTLSGVVKHAKHALEVPVKARPGDLLLISQTRDSLPAGQKPIQHVMEFVRCYEDLGGESEQIWGKRWKYIIEGRGIRALRKPFRMEDIQVSRKNYLQGGTMVYVDPMDVKAIIDARLLDQEGER